MPVKPRQLSRTSASATSHVTVGSKRVQQQAESEPFAIVGYHLDLKGLLPRRNYLPRLLDDLAGQGINTVLVEYEDIFPFRGLEIASEPSDVWSPSTVRSFQARAAQLGMNVIPLQQCLGHLEYVYRWQRYRKFAENPRYPSTLCLSNPRAVDQVISMLAQVIQAHPDSKMVHLGMDEAHHLATCPRCRRLGTPLQAFLSHLDRLCTLVEQHGKTPLIWSDMLEDHFDPKLVEPFRDRVILMPWDYGTTRPLQPFARVNGNRTLRCWIDRPDDPQSPPIGGGTRYIEDLPPHARKEIAKYQQGDLFTSLYQVDVWTQRGFRVIGATAVRSSSHGAVLPRYHKLRDNIRTWAGAIRRNHQLGLIATSWARGTTFCPPNFPPDLAWPNVEVLARESGTGSEAKPFWPGVPARKQQLLFAQLGRSRDDWSLESAVASEMEALAPKVKDHKYDWQSIALMAHVLAFHRRAGFIMSEVDYFHANHRPVEPEWQRRIQDQTAALSELKTLREKVRKHFGKRYAGEAFEEWLRDLFDAHEARLIACRQISRKKLVLARRKYRR